MPIVVNIDVMMARRKMSAGELDRTRRHHARESLHPSKTNKAKAIRFFPTLEALCKALDCKPADILDYTED